ncbi:hypothetical protein [Azohydromonas aeria]|uniref:hypothetical protein n=1 Tax=Azohydromonas aeria TaxID=2590212 RepID=UPI0012F9648E|nr:hypothetical protein [Azohydromonas aeria]
MADSRFQPRPRLGLSFEPAPAPASHPLRTDIACFVGTVARRRRAAVAGLQPMPAVLARWLGARQVRAVGGVPVQQLRVSLESGPRFVDSVLAAAEPGPEHAALAEFFRQAVAAGAAAPRFAALLRACRELAPVPEGVLEDLRQRGLYPGQLLAGDELGAWLRMQRLLNLPVAVDSFDAFDALFAWERRGVRDRVVREGDPVVVTALGAALRAFFGEGGRRAWVVRTGDPSDLFDSRVGRFAACFPEPATGGTAYDRDGDRCPQLPGIARRELQAEVQGLREPGRPVALSAADWVGLEHVYDLGDVSFALLPDLVDAAARAVPATVPPAEVVAAREAFAECVEEAAPDTLPVGRRLPPPRLDAGGLALWRELVLAALALLDNAGRAHHRRDVQLLASLPLLGDARGLPPAGKWLAWMAQPAGWLDAGGARALLSDRLQLAYPWVVSRDSADCPGGCEAPEGTLAGVLARNALERGAWRSAAGRALHRWQRSEPALAWAQATQQSLWTPLGALTLGERVCLLGPSPRGPRLLSDVGCGADPRTRQASVRRLLNVVLQAARGTGEELAFEPSGEALWARVRERLADLMRVLLAGGALSTDGTPFTVRCGRDTMTANDLDAGRVIAHVEILPAQPIQRIVVVLNLRDAGPASAFASAA